MQTALSSQLLLQKQVLSPPGLIRLHLSFLLSPLWKNFKKHKELINNLERCLRLRGFQSLDQPADLMRSVPRLPEIGHARHRTSQNCKIHQRTLTKLQRQL